MKKVIVSREDLVSRFADVTFAEVRLVHFRDVDGFEQADEVVFDDEGRRRHLKRRGHELD